jgi:hypothetical protein
MIDELPLDLFGEADSPTEPQPARADPAPQSSAAEPTPAAGPMTVTHRRVYDGIAIVGLGIVLGVVMRVVALGWSLPVANLAIAALIYLRGRPAYRAAYIERMETLRARLEEERTALTRPPAPELPREHRWLYDGLAVVVIGGVGLVMLLLLGFESWLPTPWAFAIVGGAIAYFWLGRGHRAAYYTLAEQYRRRLFDVQNEANPG